MALLWRRLVLWEGGKFNEELSEANSISGAMLNEFKRKDWGEEKNWRGGGAGEVFLLPSPTRSPPTQHVAPEIKLASSNFPPSHKTASYCTQATDIADVGKLCYLQGATKIGHETVQLKQKGKASQHWQHLHLRSALRSVCSQGVQIQILQQKSLSSPTLRRKHQYHQTHHLPLVFSAPVNQFFSLLNAVYFEVGLLVYLGTKEVSMFLLSEGLTFKRLQNVPALNAEIVGRQNLPQNSFCPRPYCSWFEIQNEERSTMSQSSNWYM